MKRIISLICLLAICMTACASAQTDIDALMGTMTVREKVGQLFCVRPDAVIASGSTVFAESDRATLEKYPVGGFIFFGANIKSPAQLETLMQDLGSVTRIPPYYAVDEEGGSVARIGNSSAFSIQDPGNMGKIGKTGDPENARAAGREIGAYLKDIGFHLDFAPVADVRSSSGVIGNRSFSSDPAVAAEMVAAAVEGFHESGVACTLKHFPGHGAAAGDTHTGRAATKKTWEEMQECEMLPFEAGIAAGADAVMMAHIDTPNAAPEGMPASLSPTMARRLRDELGFDGLIITDSLAMGAVTAIYESDELPAAAFYAGADVLLMPENLFDAFDALVWAVEEGILPMERLDESVRRVLEFKLKYGLI